MAEKKSKKPGRPKGRKPAVPVQIRVPPDLHAAMSELAEQARRTKNTEFLIALEEYLRAKGVWPKTEDN